MMIRPPRFAPLRPALWSLLALALVGCRGPAKSEFAVSLHNASERPVTVWLTKTGGPPEPDWLAPEDLSNSRAAAVGMVNGVVIPAGKTGDIGPLTGRFADDSLAVLRVYSGQLTLDQLLATGPDSTLRVDVPLREGRNLLVVKPGPKLTVDQDAR